jgi:hypothetical protein
LFLAGAVAAAVPIVLHLLKREPEARVKFAAVKLIKQAPVEYTDRRRLRELLLLALRVTALLLLALAFARPFVASGAAVGTTGVTVVALDTSYSLAAPGRFERARQLAKDAVPRRRRRSVGGRDVLPTRRRSPQRPVRIARLATMRSSRRRGIRRDRYQRRALRGVAASRGTSRHGRRRHRPAGKRVGAGDRASVPEGTRFRWSMLAPCRRTSRSRPSGSGRSRRGDGPQRLRRARVCARASGDRQTPAGDATVSLGANQSSEATFAGAPRGTAVAVTVTIRTASSRTTCVMRCWEAPARQRCSW